MTDSHLHYIVCYDDLKKKAERVAALLNYDTWYAAVVVGMNIISEYAESHVRGKTHYVFCTPELDEAITNNPEFFDALCEPGVIEWLTPFVLTKSKQVVPEDNPTLTST